MYVTMWMYDMYGVHVQYGTVPQNFLGGMINDFNIHYSRSLFRALSATLHVSVFFFIFSFLLGCDSQPCDYHLGTGGLGTSCLNIVVIPL